MSNKILYINYETGSLINADGSFLIEKPSLMYKSQPIYEIHFLKVISDTVTPVNISDGVAWNIAVDTDYNALTTPMTRTLDADIDKSRTSAGIITAPIETNTSSFFEKINNKQSVNAMMEIRGMNSSGKVIYSYIFSVVCLGAVDPDASEPIPVPSSYATQNWVYSVIRAGYEVQFAATSTGTWHYPREGTTDNYWHFRYPAGLWSEPMLIVNGENAPNMAVQYSLSGDNWHDNPVSTDYYMRFSTDASATWSNKILFHGADFTAGEVYATIANPTTNGYFSHSGSALISNIISAAHFYDTTLNKIISCEVSLDLFNNLSGKVNQISSVVSSNAAKIAYLSSAIDTANGDIDYLSTSIDTTNDNIDELSSKISTLTGNINTLSTKVNILSANTSGLSSLNHGFKYIEMDSTDEDVDINVRNFTSYKVELTGDSYQLIDLNFDIPYWEDHLECPQFNVDVYYCGDGSFNFDSGDNYNIIILSGTTKITDDFTAYR